MQFMKIMHVKVRGSLSRNLYIRLSDSHGLINKLNYPKIYASLADNNGVVEIICLKTIDS
jgi:hypothetical protein